MADSVQTAREGASGLSNGLEKAKNAKDSLQEMKADLSETQTVMQQVGAQLKDLAENFKTMSPEEKMKALGGVAAVAFLGLMAGEDEEKGGEGKKEEDVKVTDNNEAKEEKANDKEVDKKTETQKKPETSEVGSEKVPVARKTKKPSEIREDYEHNLALMKLLPSKEGEVNQLAEKYEKNREKYERVANAVGLPPVLIAALHFRESSMSFKSYLHNGDPLGKTTTHVPEGILFKEGDWEKAAIHALGGGPGDENGKPPNNYPRNLAKKLGLTENSTDVAAMLAFAEMYNGLGYRDKGLRSTYTLGGTDINSKGAYVADGKFDPNKVSNRVGVAAFIMGVEAREKGQPLKIAADDRLVDEKASPSETRVS